MDLETLEHERSRASDRIVESTSSKRLVVAGPGCGKSFTFHRALAAVGGGGLALTFIRNLVSDLEKDLGDVADVFTFHSYCKYLMHHHDVAGLRDGDYYPPLIQLLVEDIFALRNRTIDPRDVEKHLHNLDESDSVINEVLATADYYNAVSHTDLVYRVLRHFQTDAAAMHTYPLIVVDEYQDFSLLETTFIELLATRSPVLIAGDDDQALYTGLRYASPEFIRNLASDGTFDLFELPYCSRCTSVVVAAVNDVLEIAVSRGYLENRLEKPFECYLPDKKADSQANPAIIHVECSTANTPYAGKYVAQQIAQISDEDVARSRQKGYPTALVVGPNPFLKRIYEVVQAEYPGARMKMSSQVEIDILDGYRRIASADRSRLGWRIVIACDPVDGGSDACRAALEADVDLVEHLPEPYTQRHRELARLVAVLLDSQELSPSDEHTLTSAVNRSLDEIKAFLEIEDQEEGEQGATTQTDTSTVDQPDILFTSLVGAKGLSAEHVFVVGMNDGHFPRDSNAPTDEEICRFLVALSRTRKRCHVISCKFFGTGFIKPSVFLAWIRPHLETIAVDKNYDFS